MDHHKESPSKYNAWANCIEWDSSGTTSVSAKAGTDGHAELEKGLKDLAYEPNLPVSRWAKDEIVNISGGFIPVGSEVRLVGSLPVVKGVYGMADAVWPDSVHGIHIADFKTFSDGTEDYSPQLRGYATLMASEDTPMAMPVFLHILHGGIRKVETITTTMKECVASTTKILESVRSGKGPKGINKFCQYCSHIKECKMVNQAVEVVHKNEVSFSNMSLTQKMVVCDAVSKMIDAIRKEAKERAIENGGFIESDGIRYEMKERAGKGRVKDLCDVASAMTSPKIVDKNGDVVEAKGISQEQLLSLCELPKTAFVDAMKKANADMKDIPKKNIESFCKSFYEAVEPSLYLARVK